MSPDLSEECYAFASFRLFPKQRTLLRGNEVVPIGGRAFDVLLLLVSRAGVVVSLGELMSFVWPSVTVEEANLRVQMGMLRKILAQCEDARRAIETVPLRGYCFILTVRHHPNGLEPLVQETPSRARLPMLLNPPVGRDETIEVVASALEMCRLVTITGAGGIGKTTVAIATANRFAQNHAGAISFVDLSDVASGDDAAAAIAQALSIDVAIGALPALCEQLRGRELLLILDTCEHIVEPMAALVETLLIHCSELKLLVTSREALRATGEWTHRLSPLRFPTDEEELHDGNIADYSAVTLLVDRVRSSMRFAIAERDMPFLSEICRRLDGIPLALEFAAARVADLGLREIAAHLDDRFAFLTRGRRTALPRHRTLTAAFDWSYSLLGDDEQRMLRHLARCGGAFSAEHAIAIGRTCGCSQPAEALAGLYEKSLLAVDVSEETPTYSLLDTTRAYVASRNETETIVAELASPKIVLLAQA